MLQVIDYRDLDTGLMAMNRMVGFPAAIAARMIADGDHHRTRSADAVEACAV